MGGLGGGKRVCGILKLYSFMCQCACNTVFLEIGLILLGLNIYALRRIIKKILRKHLEFPSVNSGYRTPGFGSYAH